MLARILQISGTHTDSTLFWNSFGQFFNSGIESTSSRYSPGFYHFLVLTLILPFFETRQESFSIVARSLPFLGAHPDSTIFQYSQTFYHFLILVHKFFNSAMDSTFSRYSPWFYQFLVVTLILPFSDNRPYSFLIVARILPFPGARPDSTNFLYSHWFYPFPKLVWTVFQ